MFATDSSANVPADKAAPVVVDAWPRNGQAHVSIWSLVEVSFSESMNEASVLTAFSMKDAADADVPGEAWLAGYSLLFVPEESFTLDAAYTATVAAGALDLAGNALADARAVAFTTGEKLFVSIAETSAVPPVFIEGEYWVPEGVVPEITATGPKGTVAATLLGERNFMVNVPLVPGANEVTVAMNGADVTNKIH